MTILLLLAFTTHAVRNEETQNEIKTTSIEKNEIFKNLKKNIVPLLIFIAIIFAFYIVFYSLNPLNNKIDLLNENIEKIHSSNQEIKNMLLCEINFDTDSNNSYETASSNPSNAFEEGSSQNTNSFRYLSEFSENQQQHQTQPSTEPNIIDQNDETRNSSDIR